MVILLSDQCDLINFSSRSHVSRQQEQSLPFQKNESQKLKGVLFSCFELTKNLQVIRPVCPQMED